MLFAETERLRLRSFEESDLPMQVELLNDWDVMQWMATIPYPFEEKHGREWMDKMAERAAAGRPEFFAIADRTTDLLLGCMGVHPVHNVAGEEGDFEIGYWLGKRHWGKGYVTEAMTFLVPWALGRPWIKRLIVTTDENNQASINVLKKSGFIYTGMKPGLGGRLSADLTTWVHKDHA